LRQILVYSGVSDADMEKGQMRCDVNISVRPSSQTELGTKIELKNLNSVSAVRRSLHYEIARQIGES
jgi:aspartyl-tRNA(Asn)/glutamyl-tRNA(Gln) amidotransferase subunit B